MPVYPVPSQLQMKEPSSPVVHIPLWLQGLGSQIFASINENVLCD